MHIYNYDFSSPKLKLVHVCLVSEPHAPFIARRFGHSLSVYCNFIQ